jgi:hypothetical protein
MPAYFADPPVVYHVLTLRLLFADDNGNEISEILVAYAGPAVYEGGDHVRTDRGSFVVGDAANHVNHHTPRELLMPALSGGTEPLRESGAGKEQQREDQT